MHNTITMKNDKTENTPQNLVKHTPFLHIHTHNLQHKNCGDKINILRKLMIASIMKPLNCAPFTKKCASFQLHKIT